jgi:hypothetical protein
VSTCDARVRAYVWTAVLIAEMVGGFLLAPRWIVLTVSIASLGASIGHCLWEQVRCSSAARWGRLIGGFMLCALNFSAVIIVAQSWDSHVARLLLEIALYAGTFVAGLVFGSAVGAVVPVGRHWHEVP